MKPDWKDAPEWARYLAMNEDGAWHWFSDKPFTLFGDWRMRTGKFMLAAERGIGWLDSLERRP